MPQRKFFLSNHLQETEVVITESSYYKTRSCLWKVTPETCLSFQLKSVSKANKTVCSFLTGNLTALDELTNELARWLQPSGKELIGNGIHSNTT